MAILISFLATFCYFIPPQGWQCAQPKNLSSYVQVGFVTEGKRGFRPSISLAAEEEIDVPLKQYIKEVKALHLEEPGTTWRDLGKLSMRAGVGRLTEISAPSPCGPTKMLQAFFQHGTTVYILTAAVLQEEFPIHRQAILDSIKTLQTAPDLFSSIPDEAGRSALQSLFASQDDPQTQIEQLKKVVESVGQQLGPHWQFLALKEGYAKIHAP